MKTTEVDSETIAIEKGIVYYKENSMYALSEFEFSVTYYSFDTDVCFYTGTEYSVPAVLNIRIRFLKEYEALWQKEIIKMERRIQKWGMFMGMRE